MNGNKAENIVIPAILAHSEEEFRRKVENVRSLGAMVQIDVMDGTFVDNTSWADSVLVPEILGDLPFEVHLMVSRPEGHIAKWLNAGARRIWFHIEATTDAGAVITAAGEDTDRIGVALNPDSPVSLLNSALATLRRVLVMGVQPGWSGQEFLPVALRHIEAVRKQYPDATIVVDGGVNDANVGVIRTSGADEVVAGASITDAKDPRAAYDRLR
jgi:ribulose-phosphate 3-epimerase